MDHLIAGNGPAAVYCAEAIRKHDKSGKITMLSPEEKRPYSRITIPEYLTGEIAADDIYFRPEDFYSDNNIEIMSGIKLTSVEPDKHIAVLSDSSRFHYDKLLLATGSRPVQPSWIDFSLQGVYSLWDKADAEKIAGEMKPGGEAVIIGGGLVGLQAARALIEQDFKVCVIETMDRLMSQQLDIPAAEMLRKAAENVGIRVQLSSSVKAIRAENSIVRGVTLRTGKDINASLLLVCTGVRPNLAMLDGLGLDLSRGIETDEYMRTPLPDIYAAGDVVRGPVFPSDAPGSAPKGGKEVRAIWINAVEQGICAGTNMAGGASVYAGSRALNSIQLFGLTIASAGKVTVEENQCEAIISCPSSGNYSKLIMSGDILAGAIMAGDISRAGPLFQKIGGPLAGYLGPGADPDSTMLRW